MNRGAAAQGRAQQSRRLAWLLFGLCGAFALLDLWLLALSWSAPVPDAWGFRGYGAILALALGGIGQMLAWHRPQNAIGWLFLVAGVLSGVDGFAIEYAAYAVLTRPGLLPGGSLAAWLGSWLWLLGVGILIYIFLLFPTGQLPSARWRPVGVLVAGGFALTALSSMFTPGPLYAAPYLDNPVVIPGSDVLRGIV